MLHHGLTRAKIGSSCGRESRVQDQRQTTAGQVSRTNLTNDTQDFFSSFVWSHQQ